MIVATSDQPSTRERAIPFTQLRTGDQARLAGSELDVNERETLAALGLGPTSRFRVARAGNPWIVQVHATRIGLTNSVARALRVVLE